MNNLLKSDVEGVLEHVAANYHNDDQDQVSHTVISLISREVEQTRQRLDDDTFEQELHAVLFRAWQQYTGSYRPYAKFHHRSGLKTIEYYQLLHKFDLWNQLAATIYALPPELAIDIIETLGQIRLTDEGERAYIAIYLTVCASLPVRQRIEKCEVTVVTFLQKTYNTYVSTALLTLLKSLMVDMKTAVSINSDLKERIPSIFLNLLNQMKEAGVNNDCIQTPGSQPWQKLFWMRLLQLFTSPYGHDLTDCGCICYGEYLKFRSIYDNEQTISIINEDASRFSDDLYTDSASERHIASKHHASFVLIFKKIATNCPFDTFAVDDIQGLGKHNDVSTAAYRQKTTYSFETESNTLGHCVEECLYRTRNHLPGWKSFLELAVDYQDIVFSYIEPGSEVWDVICNSIASEKLYWKFFERLVHIVKVYHETDGQIDSHEIQTLCKAFMAVFNSIHDLAERFNLRNLVHYSNRYGCSESLHILFESFDVWPRSTIEAYNNDLKILCNQIVEDNEIGEVDGTLDHHNNLFIIEKLCTISVVMPHSVVCCLVMECIRNKGQASAIGHILQMSGGLCSLMTSPYNTTLLVDVLSSHDVIGMLDTPASRRNYVDMVCQWTKASTATQTRTAGQELLNLTHYYEFCLIPELSKAMMLTSVNTSALPALIQLISMTLGMHFDEGKHDLTSAEDLFNAEYPPSDQGRHAFKHRKVDFLKRLNWIQMLADLATLLSTRAQSLDQLSGDKNSLQLHMTFADWEACIFALEVLVATSEDHINEYGRMLRQSNETEKTPVTLTAMAESMSALIDKFSDFNWDLQLRLYPSLNDITLSLALEMPSMIFPVHLKEFLEDFNGPIAYQDRDSDESNKWTLLMMACKSASYIHNIVIKNLSSSTIYTTGKLHPYRSINFATGMYQALLPSKTMSVLSEYKVLLIDFLGKLYDMPNIPELVRNYDYDSEYMNRMVKVLEHEDLRVFHSIIYSKLLLSTSTLLSKPPNNSEGNSSASSAAESTGNHATYFVASIMRVIQSLRNWSEILVDGQLQSVDLQRLPFSDYLRQVMPELHHLPVNTPLPSRSENSIDGNGTDALENAINTYIAMSNEQNARQQDTGLTANQPRELLFPPDFPSTISSVNLSVITLNILAQAKSMLPDGKLRDTIWILMSQVVEGICNDPYRKRLVQAARKAGKASIKNWKKRTDEHKYIIRCRPILSPDQHNLTQDTLTMLHSEQERQIISDKLDLNGSSNAKAPSYYL